MTNSFKTIVAGITKKNLNGEKIQTILKDYVEEYYDSNRFDKDDYEYWSNEEIELFEKEIYQYELEEEGTISLVPQPDNPYDPNAIMVYHRYMGMIGYIPKSDNVKLAKYISDNDSLFKVKMKLEGGPHKYYDESCDSVRKSTGPYYIRLFITPLEDIQDKPNRFPTTKSTVHKQEHEIIDYKPKINPSEYKYDLFEWLAMSDYPYHNKNIKKQEPIQKVIPKQENNNTNTKTKEYKDPILYLTGAIVFIILTIILIISKNYILSIIPIIMSIFFIKLYLESKNKDGKKWKNQYH